MVSCGKTNPTGSGEGSALFGRVEGTLIQAADVKAEGQPTLGQRMTKTQEGGEFTDNPEYGKYCVYNKQFERDTLVKIAGNDLFVLNEERFEQLKAEKSHPDCLDFTDWKQGTLEVKKWSEERNIGLTLIKMFELQANENPEDYYFNIFFYEKDGQPHLKLVAKSLSDEGTPFEMEIKGMINLDTPWLSPLKTEEYSFRAVG